MPRGGRVLFERQRVFYFLIYIWLYWVVCHQYCKDTTKILGLLCQSRFFTLGNLAPNGSGWSLMLLRPVLWSARCVLKKKKNKKKKKRTRNVNFRALCVLTPNIHVCPALVTSDPASPLPFIPVPGPAPTWLWANSPFCLRHYSSLSPLHINIHQRLAFWQTNVCGAEAGDERSGGSSGAMHACFSLPAVCHPVHRALKSCVPSFV